MPAPIDAVAFKGKFPEFSTAEDLLVEEMIEGEHALWKHQQEGLGADAYAVALGYRVAVELSRSPFGTNARLEALVPIWEAKVQQIEARLPGSPLVIDHQRCP